MTTTSGRAQGTDSSITARRLLQPQTFAITGATGYLGSHLARRLHQLGHKVVILKRARSNIKRIADIVQDLTSYDIDAQGLGAVFEGQEYTCILHCATDYGRKDVSLASIIDTNVIFPLRLLEAAIQHNTPFFVNADTALNTQVSAYALSKGHFRDWFARHSSSICGINIAIEQVYGPGDDATKFIGKMVRQLLTGESCIALTLGEQRRDFVYVDDVVDAFMTILQHHIVALPLGDGPRKASMGSLSCYEVGAGEPVSIRDVMTTLCRLTGRQEDALKFGAIPYRDYEVMYSQPQMAPLLALGWRPQVALEDGLRRVVVSEQIRIQRGHQCDT